MLFCLRKIFVLSPVYQLTATDYKEVVCLESHLACSDSCKRKIGSVSKSAFPVAK